MKYILMSLAMASAALSTPVLAESGNVVVSGNIATAIAVGEDQNGRGFTHMVSDSAMAFSGQEDLGNGSVAYWRVGTLLDSDGDASHNWNTDDTFIGVKGAWGDLVMGRVSRIAPWISDAPEVFHYVGQFFARDKTAYWFNLLEDTNTLAYTSPKFGGVNFVLATGSIDRTSINHHKPSYAAGVRYDAGGGRFVGATYMRTGQTDITLDDWRLFGGFKAGGATIDLALSNIKAAQNGQKYETINTFGAVLSYPVSDKLTVFARITHLRAWVIFFPEMIKYKEFSLGARYALGKRTSLGFEFSSFKQSQQPHAYREFAVGINQDF